MTASTPVCHVVAGPNGAGKSTFALQYLPDYAGSIEFVNPDLMAQGLSPVNIRLSAIKAGRLALGRIAELIAEGVSFGFETTLSGRGHLKLIEGAKAAGYRVHLYYLWMPAKALLSVRIRHRVLNGGHDVPNVDVMRRYARSVANVPDYSRLADEFIVFDAVGPVPEAVFRRNGGETIYDAKRTERMKKELAL